MLLAADIGESWLAILGIVLEFAIHDPVPLRSEVLEVRLVQKVGCHCGCPDEVAPKEGEFSELSILRLFQWKPFSVFSNGKYTP